MILTSIHDFYTCNVYSITSIKTLFLNKVTFKHIFHSEFIVVLGGKIGLLQASPLQSGVPHMSLMDIILFGCIPAEYVFYACILSLH